MRGKKVQPQVDAVLEAAQNHLYWPPDLLALTGDIADETEEDAFRAVYRRLAERLAGLNIRVCCIPGNHDHSALLNQLFTEQGARTTGAIRLGEWEIISLDSSVPGCVGGELSAEQLTQINEIMAESSAAHLLVMLHHPVIEINCRWLDEMRVSNGGELLEVLEAWSGGKAVIWGHAHQEFDETRLGIRLLGAPAACPVQFKPLSDEFALDEDNSAGFRWCLLHEDGTIDTGVERVPTIIDKEPESI